MTAVDAHNSSSLPATTMMEEDDPPSLRRQPARKRRIPERYGFEDQHSGEVKRRRQKDQLHLCDLPCEILRDKVFSFLSSSADWFGLQTTNKLFRNLSNSTGLRQSMKLLPADTANNSKSVIIRPQDSAPQVITRLLPFAQASNLDALLLLGKLVTYFEDDLQVGMALLQKGMELGDHRCQYELANLLIRNRRNAHNMQQGQLLLQQSAEAGHAPSRLSSSSPVGRQFSDVYHQATAEMKSLSCLEPLLRSSNRKPPPPRSSWVGSVCRNPLCTRQCYRVRRRRARNWLKVKPPAPYWKELRSSVLETIAGGGAGTAGSVSPYFCSETAFFVPDFHYCARCLEADYCGRACQVVHWQTHKLECRPPPPGRGGVGGGIRPNP